MTMSLFIILVLDQKRRGKGVHDIVDSTQPTMAITAVKAPAIMSGFDLVTDAPNTTVAEKAKAK